MFCTPRPRPVHKTGTAHVPGKSCRSFFYKGKDRPPRPVPAFTYQALQKNTIVIPPQKIRIFKKRPVKETLFKMYFNRGDIPATKGSKSGSNVKWFCEPKDLDYCYYLPIFVDGLADSDKVMRGLAQNGAMDMIMKSPHKILPVLPKLILPLKRAFNTHDKDIIIAALKVLQTMVLVGPCVGQALVPYYRQLLSVCNMYKNINVNLGHGIDPDRDKRIGDVIEDTLSLLETCGGPNAFINIKYMIPTYESSTHPICDAAAERAVEKEVSNLQNQGLTSRNNRLANSNPQSRQNATQNTNPNENSSRVNQNIDRSQQ